MIAGPDLRRFLSYASQNHTGGFLVTEIGVLQDGDGSVCTIGTFHERAGHLKFTVLLANGSITTSTRRTFPNYDTLGRVIDEHVPSWLSDNENIFAAVHRVGQSTRIVDLRMEFPLPDVIFDEPEGYDSLERRFWHAFREFYVECAGAFFDLCNLEQLERWNVSQLRAH